MKTLLVICAIISVSGCVRGEDKPIEAVAVLSGDTINGTVYFSQAGCGQPVTVTANLTGLLDGGHGFHVHERGDLTNGCLTLADHYNPYRLHHGGPEDETRHLGDLGNIRANGTGAGYTVITDNVISLLGSRSIVGRGLIVHQNVDDLGRGGHPDSLTTGNAGARVACGIIGFITVDDIPLCSSANIISSIIVPFVTMILLVVSICN